MDSNDSFGRSRHFNTDAFFTGKIIVFKMNFADS